MQMTARHSPRKSSKTIPIRFQWSVNQLMDQIWRSIAQSKKILQFLLVVNEMTFFDPTWKHKMLFTSSRWECFIVYVYLSSCYFFVLGSWSPTTSRPSNSKLLSANVCPSAKRQRSHCLLMERRSWRQIRWWLMFTRDASKLMDSCTLYSKRASISAENSTFLTQIWDPTYLSIVNLINTSGPKYRTSWNNSIFIFAS